LPRRGAERARSDYAAIRKKCSDTINHPRRQGGRAQEEGTRRSFVGTIKAGMSQEEKKEAYKEEQGTREQRKKPL